MSNDALARFNERWELLSQLRRQADRLSMTAPVDDDFPEIKHYYDSAEHAYYQCCKKQGVLDYPSDFSPTETLPDSLRRIRDINLRRAERWHPRGITEWSLSDWGVALAGETGELCNIIKKLNRYRDKLIGNREPISELRAELANEIADVFIYLQILSESERIDLYTAIKAKFNAVSEKHGFPERL